MHYKRLWKNAFALTGVLVLLSGCSMLPEEEAALAPPLIQPTEVTYETEEAVVGTLSEVLNENCTVVSNRQYELSFGQQSGYLSSKEVAVGTAVTKGQVLARLDCGDAQRQLEDAKISLEIQKVNLEQALSKGLPDTDTKGNKVNFAAQIAQLQINQTQLKINSLQETIDNATIYSPANGVVTYMTDTAVGGSVQNRTAVCQVADLSRLEFEYTGPKASKFKLGMEVTLTIDGKEYTGTVSATQDSVPKDQREAFSGKVRLSLSSMPEVSLGDSVRFTAVTSVKENTVIVPKNAVSGYVNSYSVQIYQDGVVTERTVEVGISNSTQIEILKGVDAGELVVVK